MSLTPQQTERLHRLAIAIAPELGKRPLYIVDASQFEGLPMPAHCLGWATQNNPQVLSQRISDYGAPGPILAINTAAIHAEARVGQFERFLLSVAVHEVAHLVPATEHVWVPEAVPMEQQLACLQSATELPPPKPGGADDPHGWRFLRRLVHLFSRGVAAGYDVPLDAILSDSQTHWQSPVGAYLIACQGEILRMRDENFTTIQREEPPAGLLSLVENDQENFRRYCT